jgi:hypothetical protein
VGLRHADQPPDSTSGPTFPGILKNRQISEILPTHVGYRQRAASVVHKKATGAIAVKGKWPESPDSMKSVQGFHDRCH